MAFRSYVIQSAAFLLLPLTFLSMNMVFLHRAGEFMDHKTIVETQLQHEERCLYGSALHNDAFAYKLEAYTHVRPDIVAIGSSRGLEFRESFFAQPFYSMGGAMSSVDQGDFAVRSMMATHVPKMLIIAVDFWWFNDVREDPFYKKEPEQGALLSLRNTIEPFLWIKDGKLTLKEYATMMLYGHEHDDCSMGVSAWKKKGGFAADGSYYFAAQIVPPDEGCSDALIDGDLATIDTGDMWYIPPEAHFSEERLDAFLRLVERVQSNGTEVLIVFPTFPRKVFAAMESNGQERMLTERLEAVFRAKGIPYLNAHDPDVIGSPDCEFVDSIHGGNVTYARLVRRMAPLSKTAFIDKDFLDAYIKRYAGGVTGAMAEQ